MADNIDIPIESSGEDGINRLTSAIDKLTASLAGLGNVSGPDRLKQQVDALQASVTTGFAEIANKVDDFGRKIRADREKSNDTILKAQVEHDNKLHAQANKFHDRQIEIEVSAENKRAASLQAIIEKRDTEELAARTSASAKIQAIIEKRDIEEYNARSAASGALQAIIEKRDLEEYNLRSATSARIQAIIEKRDVEEYTEREAAGAKLKALVERQQLELYQIKAAGQERERVLNTSFLTSTISQQLATAEKAAVYTSQGGNAAAKFGGAAAGADIAELRRQYELLPSSVKASQIAIQSHNQSMEEAHTLARGLAGGLGALWLSYGSLVPLAAGAAIAASLKNIVEVGKDVEYQLQFVAALTRETVPLDKFLNITEGTVIGVKAAAEGLRALAQNGLDVKQALQVLPEVLNLSVVGELGVEQAALAATGALSAFGLQIGDIGRVGDILAQTAASSNTSVKLLTESLKQGSVAASIYGVSIEETAAALGTLAKINITGAAAGTAYNNLLTSLYAPSKKAAEALKELGIVTQNTDGSLKNSSVLLHELQSALSQYGAGAQASFIGDITTNRGAKAVATLLQYLDEYDKKIADARNSTGLMTEVVTDLENTVQGAFNRLKNSADASFTRAFDTLAPSIQNVVDQLAALAHSEGAVDVLTKIGQIAVNTARFLLDHRQAILYVVEAYTAFALTKTVILSVAEAFAVYRRAAIAAEAASVGFAATGRLVLGVLGPIGLAIGVATLAWQAFNTETDKVEQTDLKLRNSIENNISALERETTAIKERNAARSEQSGTPETALPRAAQNVQSAQADLELAKQVLETAGRSLEPVKNIGALYADVKTKQQALADAQRLQWKETAIQEEHDIAKSIEKSQLDKQSALDQLAALAKKGQTEKTLAGEIVKVDAQGNEASRAITAEAQRVWSDLSSNVITTQQAGTELLALTQKYNAALQTRAPAQSNDELNATIQRISLEKQLFDIRNKTSLLSLSAQHQSGQLGDLEYLRQKTVLEKDALAQAALTAQAEANAVKDSDKKQAALEKYRNLVITSFAKTRELTAQEALAEQNYITDLQKKNLETEADTYAKRGNLLDAFLTRFQATYGTEISRLQQDLSGGALANSLNDLLNAKDAPTYTKALVEYNKVLEQTIRLNNLLGERKAGGDLALASQISKAFSESLSTLNVQLNTLKASSEGAGLSTIFRDAQSAQEAYAAGLPALVQLQQQLQAAATASGRPEDQKAANTAQQGILDAAAKVRAAWTAAGTAIGQSLTTAFGRGGTALGSLLSATIAYSNKRKEIDDRLANSNEGDPVKRAQDAQKASADTAAAQISYYANVSAAAKSYFTQGSTGYQLLGAAEKAFNLVQLAETFRVFAAKSATITGLLGLKVATDAESIASEGAYTASSLVLTAARSAARGVEAAVSSMAGWPFPLNFVALGATLAAVAALGIKISGGGGGSAPPSSAVRQAATGTGTVLGDNTAKSDSIANSLKALEKDSGLGLAHTISIDSSLKQLVAGISGLTSLLVRGTNLTAPTAGNTQGAAQNLFNNPIFQLAAGGPFSAALNKLDQALGGIGGKIIGAIFGGATSVQDVGLKIAPTSIGNLGRGVNVSQYTDTKTTGGLFSSDKYRTQLTDLGSEVNNQFAQIFKNLADTVTAAATALGLGGDDFAKHLSTFVIDIKEISTKGLTGDQIQKALENALSKLGDDIAKFGVSGLEQFQKVGEGYLETLTRVANDYIQVSDVLAVLGKSFNVTGIAAINLSESLITSAGGIEALASNTKFFADNFLTEAERIAPVAKSVKAALAALGQPNITTADQFKNLVLAQDLSTTAGQALYAALIALAPQFKQITDYAADLAGVKIKSDADIRSEKSNLQGQLDSYLPPEELLAKQRESLDASNRALFDQVQAHKNIQTAYESESKALQDTIDKTKSFADSLKKFKGDLLLGTQSPLTPQEKYEEAKRQFEATARLAQGGDATAQGNFTNAANAFLEASKTANASSNQYVADFQYVRQVTDKTQATAEHQVDVATSSLAALKQQVTGLAQIDASVKTVTQAIRDLVTATGATSSVTPAQTSAVETLYETLLNRHGETAGIAYWTELLRRGASIQDITNAFLSSPEYKNLHAADTPAQAPLVRMYDKITDVADMSAVVQRLDTLVQTSAQTAAQLKTMQEAQQEQTAAQIEANFMANQQAAKDVVDATNAAAASTRTIFDSRVMPA